MISGPLPAAISVARTSIAVLFGMISRISWILSCEALKSLTTSSSIGICTSLVPVPRPTYQRTQIFPAWHVATGYGVSVGVGGTVVGAGAGVLVGASAGAASVLVGAAGGTSVAAGAQAPSSRLSPSAVLSRTVRRFILHTPLLLSDEHGILLSGESGEPARTAGCASPASGILQRCRTSCHLKHIAKPHGFGDHLLFVCLKEKDCRSRRAGRETQWTLPPPHESRMMSSVSI